MPATFIALHDGRPLRLPGSSSFAIRRKMLSAKGAPSPPALPASR
jgi:hypothetical protein